jgi:DNA-binding Xre family transcriptional regulator
MLDVKPKNLYQVDGAAMALIRRRKFMSVEELASAAGVGKNTINRLEVGRTETRPATLKKIAAALDVEPMQLVAAEDPAKAGA